MLGAYMKRLRGTRTQAEVADNLAHVRGITQSTISRLEADEWVPDIGQMEHILTFLQATAEEASTARLLAAQSAIRGA